MEVRSAGPVKPLQGTLLGRSLREWRKLTAAELQLPAFDVAVATGHQAEFWHPGILAKFVWAHEQALRCSGHFLHLLVDTDTRDPLAFRAPVIERPEAPSEQTSPGSDGRLRLAVHSFGGSVLPPNTAACAFPAVQPAPFAPRGGAFPLPCIHEGIRRTQEALASCADAPDGAEQAWRALRILAARALVQGPQGGEWFHDAPWVRTRQLMQTTLGEELIARAAADPEACARAFNRAARSVPRAARPLGTTEDAGIELPFWALDAQGTRLRVGARTLPQLRREGAVLLPRAFLTSAIARAALCNRFVHGTGGALYEQATEAFIGEWLGDTLPPFDMATATVLLPFPEPTAQELVTHATRRRAWFDPTYAPGSPGPSAHKRELLATVNAAPRGSRARHAAWRAMHAELARTRHAHAEQLAELARREEADRQRAREALLRQDRTWPVPLHPDASITQMAALLRQTH